MVQNTLHDDINILDYWRVLNRYRKSIVVIVLCASVAVVIVSLLLTKIYRAEAVITPVTSKSSSPMSSVASQFGGLASMAGINLSGANSESAKFMAMLNSRTLAENVIERENLMPVLFAAQWDEKQGEWKAEDGVQPTMEDAVMFMRENYITIARDQKKSTIQISGEFPDPEVAARVVNAYLVELQNFINNNSLTMEKRNRIFIKNQLDQNKMELLEAGVEINEFYKRNRVSDTDAVVEVSFAEKGRVDDTFWSHGRTKKSKYAKLGVAGMGGVKSDLDGLMEQGKAVDEKIEEVGRVKRVPQQTYLMYIIMRRELLAKVNALLTTQFEMAKIEESKEDLAFQVIDWAVPPVKRFKPKRAILCITIFMLSVIFAVSLAFFRNYLERMKAQQR